MWVEHSVEATCSTAGWSVVSVSELRLRHHAINDHVLRNDIACWLGEQLQHRSNTAMATRSAKTYGGLCSMASGERMAEYRRCRAGRKACTRVPTMQEIYIVIDNDSDVLAMSLVTQPGLFQRNCRNRMQS